MNAIIDWVLGTSFHNWILDTPWVWPTAETLHFFGLCLLLGALITIDLRLAGCFRKLSLQATHQLLPLVFVGFAINLATGILFLFGDPERYAVNIGFQIKMVLLVLAGLNAVWFYWKINGPMHEWQSHEDTPVLAKTIGVLSLLFWFGVLIFGRLIPYVGTG